MNAKDDRIRLQLLATGMSPHVVKVIGQLRRSSRLQKSGKTEPQPSSTTSYSLESTPNKGNITSNVHC